MRGNSAPSKEGTAPKFSAAICSESSWLERFITRSVLNTQHTKHTNQSADKFSRTLELKFFSHNYPRNVKNQSTKFKSRHIARKPWRSTPHYQRRLQCTQLRRAAGTVLLSSFLRLRLFPFRVPQVIVHTENLCPL